MGRTTTCGHTGVNRIAPSHRVAASSAAGDDYPAVVAVSTWLDRELPILKAIAAADAGDEMVHQRDVVVATAMPESKVARGMKALYDAGYIDGSVSTVQGEIFDIMNISLLESGRRAVGQWPTDDPFTDLVRILETRIASEADEVRKSGLERMLATIKGIGRDVVVGVLTDLVKRQAGL